MSRDLPWVYAAFEDVNEPGLVEIGCSETQSPNLRHRSQLRGCRYIWSEFHGSRAQETRDGIAKKLAAEQVPNSDLYKTSLASFRAAYQSYIREDQRRLYGGESSEQSLARPKVPSTTVVNNRLAADPTYQISSTTIQQPSSSPPPTELISSSPRSAPARSHYAAASAISNEQARQGCVYVLHAPSWPGFVKIGHTDGDPQIRRRDYNKQHGVNFTHVWQLDAPFDDLSAREIEQAAHRRLAAVRVPGKEIFATTLNKAQEAVRLALDDLRAAKAIRSRRKVEEDQAERQRAVKKAEEDAAQKRMTAEIEAYRRSPEYQKTKASRNKGRVFYLIAGVTSSWVGVELIPEIAGDPIGGTTIIALIFGGPLVALFKLLDLKDPEDTVWEIRRKYLK